MSVLAKRGAVAPLTDLFDWLESGWPMMADLRREGSHALRIEDSLEKDRYVIRAEIPGIDPDKDVEISVADGILTISAERREELIDKGHSEFHYGSFMRRVSLPAGASEDELAATYVDGILEVTVPIMATQAQPRVIPVVHGSAK